MNPERRIIIIQTPATSSTFTQVTCLMSEEELKEAKEERPDLLFTYADELPSAGEFAEPDDLDWEKDPKGITVRGMTMPHDIEEQARKILGEE